MVEKYGIEHVGFLTLTFADHVLDPKESQRRFHSLSTGVLQSRYLEWIRVYERQKSGRIHYHLIVALASDIRTGVNFEEFKNGVYRTAPASLRAEWTFWRATAREYGFGRTELLPIRSTAEGVSKYAGKYIEKHIGQREERDKGVRLVSYGGGACRASSKFSWMSPGAILHRRKLAYLAKCLGYTADNYQASFKNDFGSKWAFFLGESISRIKFDNYPTLQQAITDWPKLDWGEAPNDSTDIRFAGSSAVLARRSQAEAVQVAFDLRSRYRASPFSAQEKDGPCGPKAHLSATTGGAASLISSLRRGSDQNTTHLFKAVPRALPPTDQIQFAGRIALLAHEA